MPQVTVIGPDKKTYLFPEGTTKDVAIRYFKKKDIGGIAASLLESRKAASKSEFEANLPESTIASRLRESRIGLLEPFTTGSMLETGKAGVEALYDALSGKGTGKGVELLKGMVTAPVRPVVNLYEGIKTGDYDKTAYGAGGFLSQTVPAVAGVAEATPRTIGELREAATAWKLPERLQTRAAANRMKLGNQPWQERALIMGPTSAAGYALGGPLGAAGMAAGAEALALIRRSPWYRGMKASAQEALSRKLTDPRVKSLELTPTSTPPQPSSITATVRGYPAREGRPEVAFTPPEEQSPFAGELKERARPAEPIPFTPPEEQSPFVGELRERARPAEPIEATSSESAATSRNFKAIEEKIAPSGVRAKQASIMVDAQGNPTAFGKKLIDVVPEIATVAKGARADAALMDGYRRVVQEVNQVEDRIPEGTTVDKIPIVSQLTEMAGDYASRGLGKIADSIERLADQWLELPDRIPWGDFLARKRAFFQGQNLRSSPMRRAYGVLMEASGRAAPELAEANSRYSVVRRALDNAQIDVNTGRRIRDVGKTGKSSAIPMSERGEPPAAPTPAGPTGEGPKPVQNRGEALDLLKKNAGTENAAMESDIRDLHHHTGRVSEVPSQAATKNFISKLRQAAERYDPEVVPFVDRAEAALASGNHSVYVSQTELAIMQLHKALEKATGKLVDFGPGPVRKEPAKPMLGQNPEEAMRIAAAGRRPELLKEGKQFDETGLVNSPLFQGRGGPQGFLGTDMRAEPVKPATKIGGALPNPEVEDSAVNDMKFFADDIRQMQAHREKVSGGGATTAESNVAGKEIEENLSAEWSKVGKSLGLKPPPGLEDMSPGRIAKAVEKGKGADFERVKKAFMDAAKSGFSAYRESQRESGTGPGVLRERALALMRKRLEQP